MDSLRVAIGELALNEEDVLTYALFPEVGRQFLQQRRDGTLLPEPLNPPQASTAEGCPAPVEFNVTFHGETYHIKVTGSGHRREDSRPLYVTVDGLPEEVLLETLEEIDVTPGAAASSDGGKRSRKSGPRRATRPGDVTTSMPGTVIDVLVSEGQQVTAGDPVLVIEAMKMESEIPAPISGTVKTVNVTKGQAANPDDALIEIEA
jgi:pyruvate carboxylase subunit B